jgi:hypothetical protein
MPEKEFFEELQLQLNREYDLKDKYDSKANTLMTIEGTMATLLFGFGVIFFGQLDDNYIFLKYLMITFVGSVILIIISITLCIFSHLLRDYWYPMGADDLYENGKPKEDVIAKFRTCNKKSFYDRMVKEYLVCINKNSKSNLVKSKFLVWSHWVFFFGVSLIIPLTIFLIHAYAEYAMQPKFL